MRLFKSFVLIILVFITITNTNAQNYSKKMPVRNFYEMMDSVKQGWNSWDVRSMFTQLYLPLSFSIKVALVDDKGNVADDLRAGNTREDAAMVHPHTHSFDGTYSEVDASWHGVSVKLQSTSEGDRLIMLVTPIEKAKGVYIRVSPQYAWEHFSIITGKDIIEKDIDKFHFKTCDNIFHMIGSVKGENMVATGQYYLCDANSPVLIYTGEEISVEDAKKLLQEKKTVFENKGRMDYGDKYDVYNAIQSILAWDTVYDPGDDVVVSPVSRNWCLRWSVVDNFGGYMLFDWDTFFATQMFAACGCKELAYSNAFQILASIDKLGFLPKTTSDHENYTKDCSQPPVGSMSVWKIYEKFHEKWFLELTYERLLTWNKWWLEKRQFDGLLCWGSNRIKNRLGERNTGSRNSAILESGLDNSQMYDDVSFNYETELLNLQDVGLTSLFVTDCDYLVKIAKELGKNSDAKELQKCADIYRKSIQRFWCEEDGMFYNISTETKEFNKRVSCTNFYVLLANAATKQQAERIVKEHMTNEEEFWGEWILPMASKKDKAYDVQNYWKGRIWGPTNYLVYMGLRNYDFPEVRKEFAEKSAKLLLKDWIPNGYIYENWNSKTGVGNDASNSDWFYHWGALLGYIDLLEK